ncbi:MAG: hypothetical protein H7141_07020 [Burkholderiales bacterium]|nr:hypothetical protein [Bacteroidia bacterium]
MKLINKIALLALLFIVLCCNTTCKKTFNISYEGTVYDSIYGINKKPVVGAVVLLSACNGKIAGNNSQCNGSLYTIESATTDANGHFSIQSTTKLRSQAFYVGIEGSQFSAANVGYTLNNLPKELYKNFN